MIHEALVHTGGHPDVYLKDRKTMVLTVKAARKDLTACTIIYWSRTTPDQIKRGNMKCVYRDARFDYFRIEIEFSKVARYQKYYFQVESPSEICYLTDHGVYHTVPDDGFYEFLYVNGTDTIRIPQWSRGMVYYQIFPDRFCNGSTQNDPADCREWGTAPTRENYMGGDLQGIIDKVDYLQELGVDCIYLNPVFKADFNHKYATTDYFEIDPIFGDAEAMHLLIKKLHEKKIRIVLDGVFNHVGIHFKQFQDVLQKQENSGYKDWFYITRYPVEVSHHCYECVGAYKWMPKLNTANPEVREFILQVMTYWIDEFHIDGWRLDVADEVDESVWVQARILLKDKNPDLLLLGETWGSGLRLMAGNQMDSIMNYMFLDAVRDFIAYAKIDASEFDSRINKMLSQYPEMMNQAMFLPLDSHDTERFINYCDQDIQKFKLAVALQMFFVGSPAIYYGDEVGITGENDPDCRKCMVWDAEEQNRELLGFYQSLTALRKQKSCIKAGSYAVNLCQGRLYGFIRYQEKEAIYLILNTGSEEEAAMVPVFSQTRYQDCLGADTWEADHITNPDECTNRDMFPYQGVIHMTLKPYSLRIVEEKL